MAKRAESRRVMAMQFVTVTLAAGAMIGSSWLLKYVPMSAAPRLLVSLLPIPLYAMFLVTMWRAIRMTDELQQRIQLEALSFSFAATALASLTHYYLHKGGFLALQEFPVIVVMTFFYIAAIAVGHRRYA
ncbi:MAG: hypothetical protein M3081_12485 [Gemmatimonadota bacterium]|nr:hypothetical protein [Gemmatimonadota bacterium]